jgi:methyl-accepting chemotaxis protein
MIMARPYKRRNYFTKKGFQSRFMLRFIAASVLANVITVTVFILLARKKIDSLLFSMRLPNISAGALLSPEAFTASILAVVSVSLLFLWVARGMYDKISGPLHRIMTDLHTIGNGDLSCRVTLRDIDEFRDFAAELNSMVEALHDRFSGVKNQADELARTSKVLRKASDTEEARAVIRTMRTSISSLDEQVQAFKI